MDDVLHGYDEPFDSLGSLDKYIWYHGRISRQKATILLGNGSTGSFLVRESETHANEFSLSINYNGYLTHYRVKKDCKDEVYIFPSGIKFTTLAELVTYYSYYSSNLVTTLKYPVPRSEKSTICDIHSLGDWEVDRDEIYTTEQLYAGRYGEVYEGLWKKYNRKVAIKTLKVSDFLKCL